MSKAPYYLAFVYGYSADQDYTHLGGHFVVEFLRLNFFLHCTNIYPLYAVGNSFLSPQWSYDTPTGRPCLWRACRGWPVGFYHSHRRGEGVFEQCIESLRLLWVELWAGEWWPLKRKICKLAGVNLPSQVRTWVPTKHRITYSLRFNTRIKSIEIVFLMFEERPVLFGTFYLEGFILISNRA